MTVKLLSLTDLPDEPAPYEIRQLNRESLDAIPYTRLKWSCQFKGCTNGTHVRDYGILPWVWLDRGSKNSHARPDQYWYDLIPSWWMCGKHWKWWHRLEKQFGGQATWDRCCDNIPPADKLKPVNQ